jgi:hypothetical protein
MNNVLDYSGEKYNLLTAIKFLYIKEYRKIWLFKCDCGNEVEYCISQVKNGHTKSCGCKYRLNLKDKRFGRLVGIRPVESDSGKNILWELKCDCGNIFIARGRDVVNGNTSSCGCYARDCARSRSGENSPNWKPEKTQEERLGRRDLHTSFVRSVYKKDSFKCSICKSEQKKSNRLEAHHLYNWTDFPYLRFEINNNITMCQECHIEFHKIYYKKNNHPLQFEEFRVNRAWELSVQ